MLCLFTEPYSQTSPSFLCVCCTNLLKTLWKKEELVVTSNFSFSFSCSVFYPSGEFLQFSSNLKMSPANSCSLENSKFPFGKGLTSFINTILTHYQTTNFRLFQTERVCRRQFQIWQKWKKIIQTGRKHCGKRRNCLLRAISPFPTVFSKGLFPRGIKRCHCVGRVKEVVFEDSVGQNHSPYSPTILHHTILPIRSVTFQFTKTWRKRMFLTLYYQMTKF